MKKRFYLTKNGRSEIVVLIPDNADEKTLFAAEEFKVFSEKSTGAELLVVSERDFAGGSAISLGNTRLKEKLFGNEKICAGESGYALRFEREFAFIFADSSAGIINGVYDLLKEACSLTIFGADEDLVYLKSKKSAFFSRKPKTVKYAIDYRQATYGEIRLNETLLRRFGMSVASEKFVTGNVYHNAFDIMRYGGKEIPKEWLSEKGEQLCYANSEMREAFAENLKRYLVDADKCNLEQEYFVLGMEDNQGWCECENCKKISPSDAMAGFTEYVSERINEGREKPIKFLCFAYYNTLPAPSVRLGENCGVYFAPIKADFRVPLTKNENAAYLAALKGWREKTDILFVWSYNFYTRDCFLTYDTFKAMRSNYKLFEKLNVNGLYDQTESFMKISTGFGRLKGYLQSELMKNPAQSGRKLTDRWFKACFYDKAGEMKKIFFDTLRLYGKIYKTEKTDLKETLPEGNPEKYSDIGRELKRFDCIKTDAKGIRTRLKTFLEKTLDVLNGITEKEKNELVKKRVLLEKIQYEYLYIFLAEEYENKDLSERKKRFKNLLNFFGIEFYKEGGKATELFRERNN